MSKWVRLERGNDWGVQYLSVPGRQYRPSGFSRCCDSRLGLEFRDGERVRVRWDDGAVEEVTVSGETKAYEVGEHGGHVTRGEYRMPGFRYEHHGVSQWLPLDAVDLLGDDCLRRQEVADKRAGVKR